MTAFDRHDAGAADEHAGAVWALHDEVFGDQQTQSSWRGDLWGVSGVLPRGGAVG